jgi:outer membrane lipoprotein-sorting protein
MSDTLDGVSTLLRRLPLSRLLLLCGVMVAVGVGATALALAVGAGPVPGPKPLAQAVHDALSAPPVEGVSARIQLTNHLLEGSNLATGGGGEASQLASSPLLSGASGRLWIGSDGRARLELQSEKGDTQVLYDGHNVSMYDASTNTLYRYVPPQHSSAGAGGSGTGDGPGSGGSTTIGPTSGTDSQDSQISGGFTLTTSKTGAQRQDVPTVAQIQEGIERLSRHADVSGATPTDVGGQPAYTVRVSPREGGSLIAGAELSWDAVHGVPLRAAVYSTNSAAPVIELAATEISYEPVESSTLDFKPPANAKLQEVTLPTHSSGPSGSGPSGSGRSDSAPSAPSTQGPSGSTNSGGSHPHVTLHGKGLAAIALLESPVKTGSKEPASSLEGLQKVDINGTKASELPTALGTILTFERAGVRYLLAGSVTPSAIEAFARSL